MKSLPTFPGATLFLALVISLAPVLPTEAAPPLRVSEDKRFLATEAGAPFFYLGDTAWELFHRLNREEATTYLSNRAAKGFTVIQAVVLAELEGLTTPNPYGHLPLKENDPGQPVEEYFQHVDFIVNQAEELGLYVGLLPTWGDKFNKKWGVGPEIFTPDNARVYGEFLGRRYQDKPIIWILGGDRSPENEQHLAIIRAMTEGLKAGDGGRNLMTYHPQGGANSAKWFHHDAWLDFNMFQSGHGARDLPNYRLTEGNYRLQPTKPTLDGEPRYEDHPVKWKPENGWFDEFDVRQAAYWSMLSGACGHTYGDHNIWQFWAPGRKPISSARTPWPQALDHPGAFQMQHLRKLFEAVAWQQLVPDQTVLAGGPGTGADHLRAARKQDGSLLLVYAPTGKKISLQLDPLGGGKLRAFWFDPREGQTRPAGEFEKAPARDFTPPSQGRGSDWLLIVHRADQKIALPGLQP